MNRSDFIHDVLKPYYNNLHNIVKDNNESLQHLQKKYRKIISTIKSNTISDNYGKELIKDFKNVGHQHLIRGYLKNKKNNTLHRFKSITKQNKTMTPHIKKVPSMPLLNNTPYEPSSTYKKNKKLKINNKTRVFTSPNKVNNKNKEKFLNMRLN
jgi:hypothetical protein